jgi:acyl-CoA-binding protein
LYNQATEGDVAGNLPDFNDLFGRAKGKGREGVRT